MIEQVSRLTYYGDYVQWNGNGVEGRIRGIF